MTKKFVFEISEDLMFKKYIMFISKYFWHGSLNFKSDVHTSKQKSTSFLTACHSPTWCCRWYQNVFLNI